MYIEMENVISFFFLFFFKLTHNVDTGSSVTMQTMHTHTRHARTHAHTHGEKQHWYLTSRDRQTDIAARIQWDLSDWRVVLPNAVAARFVTRWSHTQTHTLSLLPFADTTCWWCQSCVGVLDAQRHYPSQPGAFEGRWVDAGAWQHLTKGVQLCVHVCMQRASVCVCVVGGWGGGGARADT